MIKKALKILLLAIVLFAIAIAVYLYFTKNTYTPTFTDDQDILIEDSIAEERRLTIGGVEQYVLLRGKSRSLPILVYVHGGPGMTSTPFLRTYNAELENHFLMVYWEQRGTNNSYDALLDASAMTIEQITTDLGELVDGLLQEFNQDKVLLAAHSWGTVPALAFAAKAPEKVHAYIAISQTTQQIQSDTLGYQWALATAKERGLQRSVEKLEALGTPPYSIEQFVAQRKQIYFLGGSMLKPISDLGLAWLAMQTPEFSWRHLGAVVDGVKFSGAALWQEQQQFDAFERYPTLDVPLYMFAGRYDRVISSELGKQYFDVVQTPLKEFVWFEASAHAPPYEEPEKFNNAVIQIAKDLNL